MIYLVTPDLPGGVNDFTAALENAIGADRCRTVFVQGRVLDVPVSAKDTVLLQFSGYGFHERGIPSWLPRECRRLRSQAEAFGIFFHELYASGPVWSSAFWLSPIQQHIVRELARMCDFWMSTREQSIKWLCRYAGDKPHATLPVFSTIGESSQRLQSQLDKVVIFGGVGMRCLAYQIAGDALFEWARMQKVEIHDIGTPIDDKSIAQRMRTNNVIQHGRLPAEEVRRMLSEAKFGVVSYPIEYVAKSSIFAAYCAHGSCPILLSPQYFECDGLVAKEHYLPGFPDRPVDPVGIERISKAAWDWYQPHRLGEHVQTLLGLLKAVKTA